MALNFGYNSAGNLFDFILIGVLSVYMGVTGLYQTHRTVAVVEGQKIYYRQIRASLKDALASAPAQGKKPRVSDVLGLVHEKEKANLKARVQEILRAKGIKTYERVEIKDPGFKDVLAELKEEAQPRD